MSDRFAYLYQPADKFRLGSLVGELSSRGITLENPVNGRVTALSEDGDQVDTTLDILERAVAKNEPLTFQFWMTHHADVCCRIRHLGGNRLVEEYGLVGLNAEERNQVLSAVIERFQSKAVDDDNLFLVGDREGFTFELDWDGFSLGGKYESALCPDVLGIPVDRLTDFSKCAGIAHASRVGKYIILNQTKDF